MVKYVGVADDIIHSATGQKVDAKHINVELTFDTRSIELDLADETYQKIAEMLAPIFAAVESPESQQSLPPKASAPAVESAVKITPEMRYTNGKAYKAACRAWAAKRNRLDEIKSYYFPVPLCNDFDAYLTRYGG